MQDAKFLIDVDLKLLPNERILTQFEEVREEEEFTKKGKKIHLLIGVVVFIYQIYSSLNESVPNYFEYIPIPLLLPFIGLVEIFKGISSAFKKFFTILYFRIGSKYSKEFDMLFVTNYRLVYHHLGQAGLSSVFQDNYYDHFESVSVSFPAKVLVKPVLYCVLGGTFIALNFLPVFAGQTIEQLLHFPLIFVIFGIVAIISGVTKYLIRKDFFTVEVTLCESPRKIIYTIPAGHFEPLDVMTAARQFNIVM
ncbi:MAG: hypothetical protein ACTSU5_04240 [Promethearchaeota archaeon]